MFTFIFVFFYGIIGTICLILSGIKNPVTTRYGKEHPLEGEIAFFYMYATWPLTLINRKNYARYNNPADRNNASWLARGQ